MRTLIPTLLVGVLLAGCSGTKAYTEKVPDEYIENPVGVAGQCPADCNAPAVRGGQIWCNNTPACTGAGQNCACYLYRMEKANPTGWEKMSRTKHAYDAAKYFYRCWCTT